MLKDLREKKNNIVKEWKIVFHSRIGSRFRCWIPLHQHFHQHTTWYTKTRSSETVIHVKPFTRLHSFVRINRWMSGILLFAERYVLFLNRFVFKTDLQSMLFDLLMVSNVLWCGCMPCPLSVWLFLCWWCYLQWLHCFYSANRFEFPTGFYLTISLKRCGTAVVRVDSESASEVERVEKW